MAAKAYARYVNCRRPLQFAARTISIVFKKRRRRLTVSQIATGAPLRRRRSRIGIGRRIELTVGGVLVLGLLGGALHVMFG